MKEFYLIFLVLKMLFVSIGFTMNSNLASIYRNEVNDTESPRFETTFNAVSDELFEADVVPSIIIQKKLISDKEWICNTYKYSDLYFHSKSSNYFKYSRFIIPGLDQTNIIFPFHDFI